MAMTKTEAVATFKRLQPIFDEMAEDEKLLKAAKKVIGDHMVENDLDTYRGISLRVVEYGAWDEDKLREHLADKLGDFRIRRPRRFLSLLKRARRA